MNKRLVSESYDHIRREARTSLKGRWVEGTIAAMLFYILTVFVRNILNLMVDNSVDLPVADGSFVTLTISGNLYDFLTTPIFSFGLMALVLVLSRKNKVDFALMFSGFSFYLKLLILTIVMAVKIILWSMLFIIPGVVAALNYSQAYFIFFDDPQKGVFQCINESIYLMRGNKANLFILSLTFIGWILLAGIATNFIAMPIKTLNMNDYFDQLYLMVSYIPMAIVLIYYYVAQAKFHDLLYLENVEGKTVIDPITGEYYVEPDEVNEQEESNEMIQSDITPQVKAKTENENVQLNEEVEIINEPKENEE